MTRISKYVPGKKITTIEALLAFTSEGQYVYMLGRVKNPLWIEHMRATNLRGHLAMGHFSEALLNPAFLEKYGNE